jgi:CRP/FNR family transcriptional regulator
MEEILSQCTLFSLLTDGDQQRLAATAISRRFKSGEWILNYGDIWPYLFLVMDGSVTAVKESMEGRSLIIETFDSCEIFWGMAFFIDDAPMLVRLVAAEDSHLLMWPKKQLQPILARNGAASWELSVLLIGRMQHASDIVEDLAFQPVAGRLARFLVDRFGETEGERVTRDLTLDEIAAHIGSTREMVSRILHRFASEGMIEITRTEFKFRDRDGLKQLAQNTND